MTNMIEVSADVGFKNVAHLLGHDLLAQCAQRVMRATPRPISIAGVAEIRFKNRLENARHRLLKQAVRHGGNTQRPRTAARSASRFAGQASRAAAATQPTATAIHRRLESLAPSC